LGAADDADGGRPVATGGSPAGAEMRCAVPQRFDVDGAKLARGSGGEYGGLKAGPAANNLGRSVQYADDATHATR